MDRVQLLQGCSHFEEAVYFLLLSFQKFLVLILSTSEGWKAESILEPPSGFEHGPPGLGIQCLDHYGISLINCPYILVFFSIAFPCLLLAHPTLFEHYCFCSFQIFNQFSSNEFLTYHPKLFSFILIHPSQLINPLPPISLLRCTKSTSFWRCSTPYIVINFLVLLSKLFNSSVFHFRVPAPVPIPYKNHPSINYHNFISSIQFQSVLTAAYTLC